MMPEHEHDGLLAEKANVVPKMSLLAEEADVVPKLSLLSEEADVVPMMSPREGGARTVCRNSGRFVVLFVGVVLGVGILAVVCVGLALLGRDNGGGRPFLQGTDDTVELSAIHDADGCVKGLQHFRQVAVDQSKAQEALKHALNLLSAARVDCGGVAMPLPFSEAHFSGSASTAGQAGSVVVWHKFASTCDSETYKFHFSMNGATATSFVTQVSKHFGSLSWEMISSSPTPCEIGTGDTPMPDVASTTAPPVVAAAKFAMKELQYQLKKSKCAISCGLPVNYTKILSAVTAVQQGLYTVLQLMVTGLDPAPTMEKRIMLRVITMCGQFGKSRCIHRLALPPNVTTVCQLVGSSTRRLMKDEDGGEFGEIDGGHLENRGGNVDEDVTELRAAQRSYMTEQARGLSTERPPLSLRYIKTGNIPATYDEIGSPCFQKITVYAQGQCNDCYANAFGQMTGIRKCLYDLQKGRTVVPQNPGKPSPTAPQAAKLYKSGKHAAKRYVDGVQEWASPAGTPCVLPFSYNGVVYSDCTSVSGYHEWCSTKLYNMNSGASGGKCTRKASLRKCENCLNGEQCGEGRYCCPYMKKCVKDGTEVCAVPIASCSPRCYDYMDNNKCTCENSDFPEKWQLPTCDEKATWGSCAPKARRLEASTTVDDLEERQAFQIGHLPDGEFEESSIASIGDAPGRRLAARTTTKGCECLKQWKIDTGFKCKNYCCNPDDSDSDWCMLTSGGQQCEGNTWGTCSAAPIAPTKPPAPDARTTTKGCICNKQWTIDTGFKCENYCCNPDDSESDWCMLDSAGQLCEGNTWGTCSVAPTAPPKPPAPDARTTIKGCECDKQWTIDTGFKCKNYCCNPDDSDSDWCMLTPGGQQCEGNTWGTCGPKPTPPPIPVPPCVDSTAWSVYGAGIKNCAWFAANDPGCTKYNDRGQMTHCKKTCNTCPKDLNNPWTESWYQYMPSATDIAGCSRNSPDGDDFQGCNGGNVQGVWNNWMRSLTRPIWVMGEKCKPYDFKCMDYTGVVNPASSDQCLYYQNWQTWHKPCSCIPPGDRPKKTYCPSDTPTGACAFQVPPAMFSIKTSANGLSKAEAVQNMQRHIVEYGPIYIGITLTNEFMDWDWKESPVYTGGTGYRGGHAVIITGWGTHDEGTDYWRIRNSWASSWGDNGYGKFKRGINLDNIEGNPSAIMPATGYKDWSPPSCTWTGWNWKDSPSGDGSTLKSFIYKPTFQCSKACTLKVFFSARVTDRNAIHSGMPGITKSVKLDAPGTEKAFELDIGQPNMCYGVKAGDMWILLDSDDGKGNIGKSSMFTSFDTYGFSSGPCSSY